MFLSKKGTRLRKAIAGNSTDDQDADRKWTPSPRGWIKLNIDAAYRHRKCGDRCNRCRGKGGFNDQEIITWMWFGRTSWGGGMSRRIAVSRGFSKIYAKSVVLWSNLLNLYCCTRYGMCYGVHLGRFCLLGIGFGTMNEFDLKVSISIWVMV
jgi:hypothetical protein